jgi:hypothetical protein
VSDLATMRARIASELRRSNITSQIASAITTAIEAYQQERFFFNERRDVTFPTVALQEFYTSADSASIPLLIKLDYANVYVGGTAYTLVPQSAATMEELSDSSTNTGQPSEYVWYGESLRLYPVPDGVYTIRLAGVFVAAAPAADDEASNPWMTKAERLIRSRAKLELAIHVLQDQMLAAAMGEAVRDAWDDLKTRTNRLTGTSRIRAWC